MESVPPALATQGLSHSVTRGVPQLESIEIRKSHVKMNPSNQTEARALKKQQVQTLPLESVWCGPVCPR